MEISGVRVESDRWVGVEHPREVCGCNSLPSCESMIVVDAEGRGSRQSGAADVPIPAKSRLGALGIEYRRRCAAHDGSSGRGPARIATSTSSAGAMTRSRTMRPVSQQGQAMTSTPVCSRKRSHHGAVSEDLESGLGEEGDSALESSNCRAVSSFPLTLALAHRP